MKYKPNIDDEAAVIQIQEAATGVLVAQCAMAAQHSTKAGYRWLAGMWGKSQQEVEDLMAIHYLFADQDLIHDSYPLRIYRSAIRTDNPAHWLQMAVDTDYRRDNGTDDGRGIWSTRQLEDAAGLARGKKISSFSWLRGDAKVIRCGAGHITLRVPGWEPTGEQPAKLRVSGKEILAE